MTKGDIYKTLIFSLILLVFIFMETGSGGTAEIYIGETVVSALVVDRDSTRAQGLSGVESLQSGTGMLFVFEDIGVQKFWMKDMLFSIDIIWIDINMEIIHIENNVRPDTFPRSFGPKEPVVKFVLEVGEGFAESHQIKIGDEIKIDR